jgi:hypothetical protein
MMRRITRRLRAFWHRRELRWALNELGLADLDELVAERGRAAVPRNARLDFREAQPGEAG